MKTSLNLTVTKLRNTLLIAALAACPLFAFNSASAQDMASATLTSNGMTSITIGQSGTFTLTLQATANFTSVGHTIFFQSNNGTGLFAVATPRVNTNAFFNDPTTSDAVAFSGDSGTLRFSNNTGAPGMSNRYDLGYTSDQVNNQPAGTFGLFNININALNAPVGTYTIFLDNRSILANTAFQDVNIGGPSGPQFTVNVVPEPSTVAFAVIGAAFVLFVAVRKHRSRATA